MDFDRFYTYLKLKRLSDKLCDSIFTLVADPEDHRRNRMRLIKDWKDLPKGSVHGQLLFEYEEMPSNYTVALPGKILRQEPYNDHIYMISADGSEVKQVFRVSFAEERFLDARLLVPYPEISRNATDFSAYVRQHRDYSPIPANQIAASLGRHREIVLDDPEGTLRLYHDLRGYNCHVRTERDGPGEACKRMGPSVLRV